MLGQCGGVLKGRLELGWQRRLLEAAARLPQARGDGASGALEEGALEDAGHDGGERVGEGQQVRGEVAVEEDVERQLRVGEHGVLPRVERVAHVKAVGDEQILPAVGTATNLAADEAFESAVASHQQDAILLVHLERDAVREPEGQQAREHEAHVRLVPPRRLHRVGGDACGGEHVVEHGPAADRVRREEGGERDGLHLGEIEVK
mmetsp:Transcript_34547/g.95311  ORF Transcript_34547/g.95311 Transcript_34547/m.95311 type:complete len:205 (-) Transcript_34547:279-893(-)